MPTKSNILIGPMVTNEQAAFDAALRLVRQIEHQLRRKKTFRDRHGRQLRTLDQVVQAILSNDWPVLEPAERQLAA
ncbi:MAG: hypothetical protein KDJ97_22530 [Anaerolineae bacterium]|nr:hypothetical protein [Anaerolineae bacterium]